MSWFRTAIFALAANLAAPVAAQECETGDVRLLSDFEGAGAVDCKRTDDGFAVTIKPEAIPINRSPWYAFDITTERAVVVTVRLDYAYGEHRYEPKIAPRPAAAAAPAPLIMTRDEGAVAFLDMDLPPGTWRISGQPVIAHFEHRQWATDFAAQTDFTYDIAGTSQQRRDIWRLSSVPENSRLTVLLLGGQHPPEVPGALAMRAFLERLSADDDLASAFRDRFRIVAFPMLNPDGLAQGHWRMTSGLADLNRDWGLYTQRESWLVGQYLSQRWAQGDRPVLMVDFHATRAGDVLYIPQSDAVGVEPFLSNWIARIDTAMGEQASFEAITGSNPGLPTARSWFTRTFAAPGVTLEIGDETDPTRGERLAFVAAESMMLQLLEQYPASDNSE